MNIFDKVAVYKPPKSVFDLSHKVVTSCNFGELIPIFIEDCVPGDQFQISEEVICRLMPLATPAFSQMDVYVHTWFVPFRLVWDDFEDWFSPDESEYDTPTITFPSMLINTGISASSRGPGSLIDQMGIPMAENADATGFYVNPLPFRALSLTWNEWYRDQDLQTKIAIDTTDGVDGQRSANVSMKYRNLRRDYFTSARPTTQKGGDVELPITGTASVDLVANLSSEQQNIVDNNGAAVSTQTPRAYNDSSDSFLAKAANSDKLFIDPNGTLEANLSSASSTTIEELRRAMVLQRWLERNMRGGTRYREAILMHYGEDTQDSRLDRPEFIHGSRTPVSISEIQQSSQTDTTPQGTLAGKGIAYGSQGSSRYKVHEHGVIISLLSVMPKPMYFEGVQKLYLKNDRFDFLVPLFARLGEQPVYTWELYNDCDETNKTDVFGYQSRYSEYKFRNDVARGEARDSLINWHQAIEFGATPNLNSDFVECQHDSPAYHRIFADTAVANHKIIVNVNNKIKALRPLPYFSTPL